MSDTPKVKAGIELIDTEKFQGFVCQCGNMRQISFAKYIGKTKSKDAKGEWTEGTKLYLMCGACNKKTEYTPGIHAHIMITRGGAPKKVKIKKQIKVEVPKVVRRAKRKVERKNKRVGRPRKM